jgi:hypothetical protein
VVDNVAPANNSLNLVANQVITTNPYLIKIKLNDTVSGVKEVKFYIDGTLICTVTTPDIDGYYNCLWDTGKYHSEVLITAIDNKGNSSQYTTQATVNLVTPTATPTLTPTPSATPSLTPTVIPTVTPSPAIPDRLIRTGDPVTQIQLASLGVLALTGIYLFRQKRSNASV